MAQGRSVEFFLMIKWIRTGRLSIKNCLSTTLSLEKVLPSPQQEYYPLPGGSASLSLKGVLPPSIEGVLPPSDPLSTQPLIQHMFGEGAPSTPTPIPSALHPRPSSLNPRTLPGIMTLNPEP